VQDTGKIIEALLRLNYKEYEVKDIAGLNFIRLLQSILTA
jgi:microsomal dipeptidase-like Zn-dependent dipeptidase